MSAELTNAVPKPTYRRHIFYVDGSIQGPLLLMMVILEVTLLASATWIAYRYLNGMVEDSLYRVHITDTGPIWKRLAKAGAWMLAAFVAINLVALMIVDGLWSRRERLITQSFNQLTMKTLGLDFSKDSPAQSDHRVLTLAESWRARERDRFLAICMEAEKIRNMAMSDPQTRELEESLNVLKSHLD